MGATRRTWSSLLWTRGTVKTVTATSVELSRAAEFQWNSRARGTERSLKEGGAETSAARDPRTSHLGTESCDKRTQRGQRGTSETSAERDQWRRLPDERHQHGTSEASAEARSARDERDQRGARPVAQATGRATSARDERGQRGSETSARRAETGRQGETSGESCRTSQEPAVPRDECEQKRISHQGRRPRDERARREPNFG